MATIALIGSDLALLEGLAQTLGASGHATVLASSIGEAVEATASSPPLVVVVDRDLARRSRTLARIHLAPGGTIVLYHTHGEPAPALSPTLQRATLADLTLPLERHRLVALVKRVDTRARQSGRTEIPTPPEHRAI